MANDNEWPDVWAKYRSTFRRYALDEYRAHVVIQDAAVAAQVSYDKAADALKEFAVRAEERGASTTDRLRGALSYAAAQLSHGDPLVRLTLAGQLFGVAAEDMGADTCVRLTRLVTSMREV